MKNSKSSKAMFGAGCFWGVEEAFRKIPGILNTEVGYAGGKSSETDYEEVCSGSTGHAEVVRLEFNEEKISYKKLLEIFFRIHDPTQKNRQGPDIGYQYRSVIFYFNESQKKEAEEYLKEEQKNHNKPIATSIEKASTYCKAEEYHQKYIMKGGKAACHI